MTETRPVQLHTSVGHDEGELAIDVLWMHGTTGIAESDDRERSLVHLVAGYDNADQATAAVAELCRRCPSATAEIQTLGDDDYLDTWRETAEPVRVGRLTIWPRWQPAPHTDADELIIPLDPGRSFGLGNHPTTRHVLAELLDLISGGERVLDVGCGSGVLAIAALRLGASSAVGHDIDPEAVRASIGNATHNGVEADFVVSSEPLAPREPADASNPDFDIIVANIGAAALTHLSTTIRSWCADGTRVVLSGLLDEQHEAVSSVYLTPDPSGRTAAMELLHQRSSDGWTTLTLGASIN